MEKGVNQVDGGIEILRQMNYPTDIINKLHKSKKTNKLLKGKRIIILVIRIILQNCVICLY